MAFNNNPPKQDYQATAGQTVFPFIFKIYSDGNLNVYQTADGSGTTIKLVLGSDYSVIIDGDNGGTVTLTTGTTLDDYIVIQRELALDRLVDYQTSGDLLANTLNADQDYQTYLIGDINTRMGTSLVAPPGTPDFNGELPLPLPEAYLRWNTGGNGLENDITPPTWRDETEAFRDETAINATNAGTSESNAATSEANAKASENTATQAVASIPTTILGYLPFYKSSGAADSIELLEVAPGDYELPFLTADGSTDNLPIIGV